VMQSRYRLSFATEMGNTRQGTPHRGIHVMINRSVGNGWNLFWAQYEGAIVETYRIFRGTTPDNLTLLQEIPGSQTSFTDFTAPAGDVYYAIEYNTVYSPSNAPSARVNVANATWLNGQGVNVDNSDLNPLTSSPFNPLTSIIGRSNVVFAGDAFNARLATSVTIGSRDSLTPTQPSMFMSANILPFTATLHAVNWTIISGGDLATISSNGVLTSTGVANGSVTVQATTIDGSNLTAQRTVHVRVPAPTQTVDAETPNITAHPQGDTYEQGETATAMSITADSPDGGTLSYQWYSNTTNSNSGGTLISGATNATYTPLTTTVGTLYYYVVVTNTNTSVNGNQTATATSNVATIVVNAVSIVNAQPPNITTHPQGATYTQGDNAVALTVTANSPDGGTLSYEWFSNTTNSNSGGTSVGTSETYTPPTTTVGTLYYYVVVTNTNTSVNGTPTATATSNVVTIVVNAVSIVNAQPPNITAHPQGNTYEQNATATALTVSATSPDGGTLSYQWHRNTQNNTTGGTPVGTNANSYTPLTTDVGTLYYYVVVTNTNNAVNGTQTATTTSNVATVTINQTGTNIADIETENDLRIYPNPITNGKLFVELPNEIENVLIQIYDLSGKLVLTQTANHPKTEINVSHLQKGVYIVKFGTTTTRIVIQ